MENTLKHSSGDLQSRLKTRKMLGVGETDDGDVHRSKLSQILGHSEQLYLRLPRGLRAWQFFTGTIFSGFATWALLFPRYMFGYVFSVESDKFVVLPIRMYGAALMSFSVVFWCSFRSMDRDMIRWSLLGSSVYFATQTVVCLSSSVSGVPSVFTAPCALLCTLAYNIANIYFYCNVRKHMFRDHVN